MKKSLNCAPELRNTEKHSYRAQMGSENFLGEKMERSFDIYPEPPQIDGFVDTKRPWVSAASSPAILRKSSKPRSE